MITFRRLLVFLIVLMAFSEAFAIERTMTLPKTITRGFKFLDAKDVPHDGGGAVELTWKPAVPDVAFTQEIKIFRKSIESDWEEVGAVPPDARAFIDSKLDNGEKYSYMLKAVGPNLTIESNVIDNVYSKASWFDVRKINLLIITLVLISFIVFYVTQAGKKKMFIRRIAGLQAVEEAVGRATEMGRSVLYVPGIQDMDDVQTLAGLTILGSVSKLTAEYETALDVPVSRSLVMSNGREVVKESYLSVGRPDMYNEDMVHYITDEQFGYVAAIDGIMVRDKPAACFYMGAFFAESLILAETGNNVGAIQIAGTAMPTQLPFFVAACDYTLIGEELFAASAYLSKNQREIASLRGQDMGKAFAMFSILFGSLLVTISSLTGGTGFWTKFANGFIRLFALNY